MRPAKKWKCRRLWREPEAPLAELLIHGPWPPTWAVCCLLATPYTADGTAWGALLLSSNAMDIVPTEDRLAWRVTGGVLDLWLFLGPTPRDVMDQFTSVVGRWVLQGGQWRVAGGC